VQVVRVLEALAAVLLEEAHDDRLGGGEHVRLDRPRARRDRRPLHLEQRLAIVAAERQLAGEHLEEEDAERIEVALRRRLLAPRLLRRHVFGGAEDGALRGESRVHRQVGEPEVEDLDEVLPAAARREEDVVALQIAVHHAEVVGARERGAHLLEDVDAAAERHRAARQLTR
jgi:hypothetical protein